MMYVLIYTNWSRSICFSLYVFVFSNLNKDVGVVISVYNLKYKYLKMQDVPPCSGMWAAVAPVPRALCCSSVGTAALLLHPLSWQQQQLLGTTELHRTHSYSGFTLAFLSCRVKMHFWFSTSFKRDGFSLRD